MTLREDEQKENGPASKKAKVFSTRKRSQILRPRNPKKVQEKSDTQKLPSGAGTAAQDHAGTLPLQASLNLPETWSRARCERVIRDYQELRKKYLRLRKRYARLTRTGSITKRFVEVDEEEEEEEEWFFVVASPIKRPRPKSFLTR